MLGSAQGVRIGITGLGVHVPDESDDEPGARGDRRDLGRMDPRANRDSRAAHRVEGRGAHRHRASSCARGSGRRGCRGRGHRPPHLRHGDARHDVPDLVRNPGRHARDDEGRCIRPPRGLHGLRLRHCPGLRDACVRAVATRARCRRRRALEDPRLGGPLHACPLRRRRRCCRHGARRPRGVHRFRAGRGRGRRRVPLVSGVGVTPVREPGAPS